MKKSISAVSLDKYVWATCRFDLRHRHTRQNYFAPIFLIPTRVRVKVLGHTSRETNQQTQ